MKCSLPPHQPLAFASFDEYDVHYQKTHMNRCQECSKNFPSEHFLHLHIAENHDPINAAKRDRGEKTYACLHPPCDRLCSTPQKRRLHCIDKHLFPRNYDFFIVNDGIDRRTSMLRPPLHRHRSSTLTSTSNGDGNGNGRRRAGTVDSVNGAAAGGSEAMEIVGDEDEEEGEEKQSTNSLPPHLRAPVVLRGRGGFGHRLGAVRGRGRKGGRGAASSDLTASDPTASVAKAPTIGDPMESLTSSMSALQFVPHSVQLKKGRGRGGVNAAS
ncbi:hypothetical protein CC78DRAFT_536750 [Lojkania enalia]|uniref:C2H2-type domain-containing protein n=1 Tax=Lojkania enalia TaxID=147567 RepID=A0A9P4K0V4_9PLEO|nr:hypothetical protein CC78DRAFT_536750 [Didymosphaeria enalia]